MDWLMFVAKGFALYLAVGILFWLLFKREIQIKKNITLYNFLMNNTNEYHYVYREGGKTVSIFLAFYIPFYILSLRRMYQRLIASGEKDLFIKESETFILDNKESPYMGAIAKKLINK